MKRDGEQVSAMSMLISILVVVPIWACAMGSDAIVTQAPLAGNQSPPPRKIMEV